MLNEQIRDKEVRLIDEDGSPLGIVPLKEAMDVATSKNLDLVKIAPKANPPVCKVLDYGKFLFEQSKKEKENRKNQKTIVVKEVWMKPKIEENDFNTKAKHAQRFLQDGNKVKVGIRFRGREMQYTAIGKKLLERFIENMTEYGEVEKNPRLEGRNMIVYINPKS